MACNLPQIFRPLIAFDKKDIIEISRKIGTYETSIIPDGGCSAVPKYPETNAELDVVNNVIDDINQKDVLEEVWNTFTKIDID